MLNTCQPITFVATANPKEAREFYENRLGLKFISENKFALVFDMNGPMLRIQIVENVSPHNYTALGWKVSDIKNEINYLKERGVKFEFYEGLKQDLNGVWSSPAGGKIAWFKDPEGNILSLTQF